ncbi:MAG TPA: DUF72 domain-containing protein [Candidatus Binatia bacterium]
MARARGQFRVGTSGYQYDHWKKLFYPEELAKKHWFAHYAQYFDTVEINNTFYRLPSAQVFDAWRKQAPPGFCYVLKFSRYGSHVKRLKEPRATIKRFLQVARRLREFLGPILVQLPPNWSVNTDRLQEFLKAAPRSLRWAFEFRDPSWLCEDVFAILQHHNAALCIHDMIADHPRHITADWVYLRFHGDHYSGSYTPAMLKAQAQWIKERLGDSQDVFAYFNNDAQGYAVDNAKQLKQYVRG